MRPTQKSGRCVDGGGSGRTGRSLEVSSPLSWASEQVLPSPGSCPPSVIKMDLSTSQWLWELVREAIESRVPFGHEIWMEGPSQAGCPQCPLPGSSHLACPRLRKVSRVPHFPAVLSSRPLGLKRPQGSSAAPLQDLNRGLTPLPWEAAALECRARASLVSGFRRAPGAAGELVIVPRMTMKKLWQYPSQSLGPTAMISHPGPAAHFQPLPRSVRARPACAQGRGAAWVLHGPQGRNQALPRVARSTLGAHRLTIGSFQKF